MTRPRDTGTPPDYNPECGLSLTCWAGQDKGPPWEARVPGYQPLALEEWPPDVAAATTPNDFMRIDEKLKSWGLDPF